jgi:hypothetical protein
MGPAGGYASLPLGHEGGTPKGGTLTVCEAEASQTVGRDTRAVY